MKFVIYLASNALRWGAFIVFASIVSSLVALGIARLAQWVLS